MEQNQTDDGTGANSTILRRVIEVNAEIRHVMALSSGIRLGAMNASLMARRAGARTRGFAVVSAEFRVFSGALDEAMLELGAQLALLVMNAAAIAKKERERRVFERARALAGERGGALDPVRERMLRERDRLLVSVAEDWGRLGQRIRRVVRACRTGVALTCSAKIEAVHGQDFAGALSQVAHQIENATDAVALALKQLSELTLEQQRMAA